MRHLVGIEWRLRQGQHPDGSNAFLLAGVRSAAGLSRKKTPGWCLAPAAKMSTSSHPRWRHPRHRSLLTPYRRRRSDGLSRQAL